LDFRFTEDQERLRQQVRAFLEQEFPGWADGAPEGLAALVPGYLPAPELERKLGARGWLGLSWPVQYGGGGRSIIDQLIVDEELAGYGAPGSESIGRSIIGPAILAFGSEEQKQSYLPRLARGEIYFCLGYTEPESGSDLASLETRAIAQGDDYVVNGHKLYTSGAEACTYCYLLARTDPDAPEREGLSVFIVPMDAPGVEVRPLLNLLGVRWFNEVSFQDVRVPRADLVGQENRGWHQITAALDVERLALYPYGSHYRVFRALLRYCHEVRRGGDTLLSVPRVRQQLADLAIEFEVARVLTYRAAWRRERGERLEYEAAQVKLFNSELAQRLYRAAVAIVGPVALLWGGSPRSEMAGVLAQGYLSTVQETVGAGTSEVMRNIIAARGLGLPR